MDGKSRKEAINVESSLSQEYRSPLAASRNASQKAPIHTTNSRDETCQGAQDPDASHFVRRRPDPHHFEIARRRHASAAWLNGTRRLERHDEAFDRQAREPGPQACPSTRQGVYMSFT